MVNVSCKLVHSSMPDALKREVTELLVERGSDATECEWEGSAPTTAELIEAITEHVKEEHALRSWPREYWAHLRSSIRED